MLFTAEALRATRDLPAPQRPLLLPLPDVVKAPPGSTPVISLSALNALNAIPPHRTPDAASLDDQGGRGAVPGPGPGNGTRPFAVADLPHDQSQPAVFLDADGQVGIAGAPRSGRTNAAVALARAQDGAVCWVGTALPSPSALTPAGTSTHSTPVPW